MTYFSNDNRIVKGTSVSVTDENFEKAMRKFKKKVADSGLMQSLREKEYYEKPTIARKKAAAAARNRWLKKLRSEALPKKLF
jgi:small subunit ribosomal protein S21